MPSVFSYSEAVSHPLGLPQHMSFVAMMITRLGLVLFSNLSFLSRPLYCSKKDYSLARSVDPPYYNIILMIQPVLLLTASDEHTHSALIIVFKNNFY